MILRLPRLFAFLCSGALLLSACSDAGVGPTGTVVPDKPSLETSEEYIEWDGNTISFTDDEGVQYRIVAHYDAYEQLERTEVYRNGQYHGGVDTRWTNGMVVQRVATPAGSDIWVKADQNYNYLGAAQPASPPGECNEDHTVIGGEPCAGDRLMDETLWPCDAEFDAYVRDTMYVMIGAGMIAADLTYKRSRVTRGSVVGFVGALGMWYTSLWKYDRCLKGNPEYWPA